MRLKYIVVGTGRCGTVYYARLLTSIGILCGHESFFDYGGIEGALLRLTGNISPTLSCCSQLKFDGIVHNPILPYISDLRCIIAESSYMAVPYLHHECLKYTAVIHIVRHPIKVVNSFISNLKYFDSPCICPPPNPLHRPFIYRHLPELYSYKPPFERAAMYYVLWNEMIETTSLLARFRVEDGPDPLKAVLGISTDNIFDDRTVNTCNRFSVNFTISMLPPGEAKDRFIAIGERYGYNMDEHKLLI